MVVENAGNLMRKVHRNAILFLTAYGLVYCDAVSAPPLGSGRATSTEDEIELHGTASGGVLVLALWYRPAYVSVETKSGEAAEAVLHRLAAKINASDPFQWWGDRSKVNWTPEASGVKVVGNTLTRLGGGLILTGTEQGFRIPKPPLFLSGSYDAEKRQVIIEWVNPEQEHDKILCGGKELAPGTSRCVFDTQDIGERRIDDLRFHVIMMRGKTPSCAGLITMHSNAQEELGYLPFYDGVMPNWAEWSTSPDPSTAEFTDGVRAGIGSLHAHAERLNQIYQVIKTKSTQVQAGVWRKFLNLKPGHTYQISASLNSLTMDAHTEPWSYSLHAACNQSDGRDFTAEQLAGVKPLPDGQVGEDAGRIAYYGLGSATQGRWVKHSTTDSSGGEGTNITLPANVSSLTVWVRHSGSNSSGVGLDRVRIEDLGLKN